MDWQDKSVLVTGGTGTFGKEIVKQMLNKYKPKRIIVFSRDELKQYEMLMNGFQDERLRYFIGDVRDSQRLVRAMRGVDIVIHGAAMKQVPACEYNPMEAIQTNIMGVKNVIDAALDAGVKKVMGISTDKAVNPTNLYGATKLAGEKLFVHSNVYSGTGGTKFSCVRYGNVIASRGSVVSLFEKQRESGEVTVTDERMTRFWLNISQAVEFTIDSIEKMEGGEVFVPKIPTMSIMEIAKTIAPGCKVKNIGIRSGEKLHETLISSHESINAYDVDEKTYVIFPEKNNKNNGKTLRNKLVPEGFVYSSDNRNNKLSSKALLSLISASN